MMKTTLCWKIFSLLRGICNMGALPGHSPGKYTGKVYQEANGDWRWRLVAENGNIVADSGEGYKHKDVAITMLENVVSAAPEGRFNLSIDAPSK